MAFVDEAPPPPPDLPPAGTIVVNDKGDGNPDVNYLPGGGVVINLSGRRAQPRNRANADEHDANLAEYVDLVELARISSDLLDGINSDLDSRQEWIRKRADGLKHLALRMESPKSPSADSESAVEGQSTVRWPGMLDAVMRFQANARGELLPAGGPVKMANWTPPKTNRQLALETQALNGQTPPPDDNDLLAEALERDFNHYLTVTDKPYYPDTNRMFFMQGFGGSAFKKVYRDSRLKRPVSRAIDAADVIVSDNEVSLHECARVTHRVKMRQSVFKWMQISGAYRSYADDIMTPSAPDPDPVELATDDIAGLGTRFTRRSADYQHTVYECYCELNIEGFEHRDEKTGQITDLPLPYRVTIEKDSQKILEIRRNWKEGDERYIARMPIVKYPFVDGLSFYGIGFLDIMGNATAAVSAAWRLALDSAGFSSWPGFIYSDTVGRQDTMNFRVPMGGGVRINTSGQDIRQAVMPLPYKDVTTGLVQVTQHIEDEARRVGGTPELMVGEGRADVPVGTTLAMLDQALKVLDSVHKGMHIAQAEELSLLRDLFVDDPDSLICANPHPSRQWEREELIAALRNCNLTPQSDPNTPSHTIRVMKAVGLVQLVQLDPTQWDIPAVIRRVSNMVGLGAVDGLLKPPAPPAAPQQDPKVMETMAKLQMHAEEMRQNAADAQQEQAAAALEAQVKLAIEQLRLTNNREQRQSQEKIERVKQETERMQLAEGALVHPLAVPAAQQFAVGWPGASNRRIL